MTPLRGLGLAALAAVVAVATIGWPGGGDDYRVIAKVENGGQLVSGNDVKIGAAKVGTVEEVRLTDDGLAEVEMTIDSEAAPLREGTEAAIRANSTVGVANRYVELAPPPGSPAEMESGSQIPLSETTAPVEFDALLDTFDVDTRAGLRALIQGQATMFHGRSEEARRAIRLFGPALSSTEGVMRELARDEPAFRRLIEDGAITAQALNRRRAELTDLVSSAATSADAIGDEASSLERALVELPPTIRRANTTFANLRAALDDLDGLTAAATPATRELTPFLRRFAPVAAKARTTVPKLSKTVTRSGKANDLTDLLGDLPRTESVASRALPRAVAAMDRSQELLDQFRAFTPDIFAAISNVGASASYYDANGHYARVLPMTSAFAYDSGTNALEPKPQTNRLGGFEIGQANRCPGGAVQPPPDGSAPLDLFGCDPSTTPPGP